MKRIKSGSLNGSIAEPDGTFPKSDFDKQQMVRQIHDAIMDWSGFIEWMQVLPKDVKEKQEVKLKKKLADRRGAKSSQRILSPEDMSPETEVREEYMSANCVRANQTKILGRQFDKNICVEMLSWMLLHAAMRAQRRHTGAVDWTGGTDVAYEWHETLAKRINAIARTLRMSKQVLKSTLSLGDGWIQRVANSPEGELSTKVDNMRSNLSRREKEREKA